ncbi:MAG: efflux RND transporter permease subunit [Vulcanimicrobiaceae bacterium]
MWLTRFAISRPVITAMVFAALAIFGVISFSKLGRSSNPPGTAFPVVVVSAGYSGASPQEMEKLIIKPIEDQLDGIDNLDQLTATAQEGSAAVVAQFKLGTNLDLAAIDVQRRVDTARVFMPNDLDPPNVYKNGASEPLLDVAVSSTVLSPTQLNDLVTNRVEPLLKAIPNVQTVDIYGGRRREFHVQPDPNRLVGMNATLADVFNAVQSNNANLPGGLLQQPTQEASVSVHADIINANDMAAIPLPIPGMSQRALRIGDIATTTDSYVDQRSISHYNGEPRLYVSISRNIDADEIKSTAIAREQLKTIEAQFPQLKFHEIDAPADYTQASLNGVWQSLGEGIFLTAIVMMLFLHAWRNAVVVLISIPTSILSTFIVMNVLGFHIDSMSLMGLSLIIGILVDDSIVVLENITRHRDLGEDPTSAAINGRTEIGGAAVAITMVDVVVFLPIAFLSGIVGRYIQEYGLVVVVATLFSLFVSFTLTPLLAAKWSVKKRSGAQPKWLNMFGKPVVNVALLALAAAMWFAPWTYTHVFAVFIVAIVLLNVFVRHYEQVLSFYRNRALPFALAHGFFIVFVCAMLFFNSVMLLQGGTAAAKLDLVVIGTLAIGLLLGFLLRAMMGRANLDARWTQEPRSAGLARRAFDWTRDLTVDLALLAVRSIRAFGSDIRMTAATFAIPIVLALTMPALGAITFDFVPQVQDGEINMTVTYPPGTPILATSKYVDHLESAILKVDGLQSVSSTVGRKPSGWGSSIGGNYAQLTAKTLDSRRGDTNKIVEQIRKLAYLVPGGQLQVAGDSGSGSGASIFYSLTGPEEQIGPAAEKVAAFLRNTPGSVNIQTSAEVAAPRLNVQIDAGKAAVLGIAPGQAALVARLAVDGAVAPKVRTDNGLVDVRVQFPMANRNTVEALQDVRVRANDGMLVPLSNVATFTWTKAPTKIERYNRERVVNVLGDVLPGYSLGAVTAPLQKKLNDPGFLPPGVGLKAQGDTEFMMETMTNMLLALVTSFMLVYMLMVILYGSFLEPFIVMFSVPLALIGALMMLAFMHKLQPESGQSLNIISMLGIVMLFGLVAKNGILLVDYSNTLVKRGMRVRDAVLAAAQTRFRPIVMTTSAMVFGMLPLALGFAEGGEWRQAMGTVIIGGLLSSLVLTLFLVPMIYNTWIGALERRADRRAVVSELQVVPAPVGNV